MPWRLLYLVFLFFAPSNTAYMPMEEVYGPDPYALYPLPNYDRMVFLKNLITRPNISVGEYTYYDDAGGVENFEQNVLYHFDHNGDKLIIGKFCAIATGVKFLMNGGNHQTHTFSAYPFALFRHGWEAALQPGESFPIKGDTVIGNDVWLGYQSVIMPGVHIGDGAIIASCSLVTKDVAPYTIVGGNPAKPIKKRFDDETIQALLDIQWWNWDAAKITRNLHLINGTDIEKLRQAE